ncbi:MAG: energy-coupling factor ABC transporter ATP-binding protein, partial [Propionibacteriaceae bacterium]|nr:energy-coupling factor ABC transporter ATP-binding protein [Propionibacteriaceae bacterium]
AGAVAMRPSVLLLDEPTAGLDPEGVGEVLTVLDRLVTTGTSLVVATHDVDFALDWAEEVIVLAPDGVRQGDPAEVLDDADFLARARLTRPWPLELASKVSRGGGLLPRNLDQVVALLTRGPGHVLFRYGDSAQRNPADVLQEREGRNDPARPPDPPRGS